jgi:hypothetical protein
MVCSSGLGHIEATGDLRFPMMMEFKYDVFKGVPKKNPLWLGSINGLERAMEQMNGMADRLPGDYFVSSATNAEVVATSRRKR